MSKINDIEIIVCGGRSGRNLTKGRVWRVLDELVAQRFEGDRITIVHGGAVWTDTWSGEWAEFRGHTNRIYPITGELDGWTPAAPFNRNKRMRNNTKEAMMCLGFPGGGGTLHMMELCHDIGIPVGDIEIESTGEYKITWWPTK